MICQMQTLIWHQQVPNPRDQPFDHHEPLLTQQASEMPDPAEPVERHRTTLPSLIQSKPLVHGADSLMLASSHWLTPSSSVLPERELS